MWVSFFGGVANAGFVFLGGCECRLYFLGAGGEYSSPVHAGEVDPLDAFMAEAEHKGGEEQKAAAVEAAAVEAAAVAVEAKAVQQQQRRAAAQEDFDDVDPLDAFMATNGQAPAPAAPKAEARVAAAASDYADKEMQDAGGVWVGGAGCRWGGCGV